MAQTTFEQDIFIAASPERVREQLMQLMNNIKEMHPFVIATQHVKTTTAPDGTPMQHYLVRDRIKIGPWPMEFTYRVDMAVNNDGKFVSNAYQSPGVHLYTITWCEAASQETVVHEYIEITAPWLLMGLTYKGATTAHKELFARLKERVEQVQTA